MKQSRYDLLLHEKNLYKAFTILAMPVFMANIIKSLHDLVDTYFIGQMDNSVAAQAGLSIAWPPINILMSFTIGLSVAGVSVISQLLGAGKKDEAKKYSGLLVLLAVGLGVLVNIILYFLSFEFSLANISIPLVVKSYILLFISYQLYQPPK